MTEQSQSSIDPFQESDILMKILKIHFVKKNENKEQWREGRRARALRVIRAEIRLTVYRSLPYQNNRKKKEQAAPHADTLDHDKRAFECNFFEKVLVNFHNFYEKYIKASYKDS